MHLASISFISCRFIFSLFFFCVFFWHTYFNNVCSSIWRHTRCIWPLFYSFLAGSFSLFQFCVFFCRHTWMMYAVVCTYMNTGWRRLIGSLILIGHFPQKWPIFSFFLYTYLNDVCGGSIWRHRWCIWPLSHWILAVFSLFISKPLTHFGPYGRTERVVWI